MGHLPLQSFLCLGDAYEGVGLGLGLEGLGLGKRRRNGERMRGERRGKENKEEDQE